MHSPGVCGAILVLGSNATAPAADAAAQSATDALGALIDALNADTEMVLVAAAEEAEALAPAVWSRAAYLVQLAPGASEADGLRALLQETLNRGRDAVLVTTLQAAALQPSAGTKGSSRGLTAEIVHCMAESYRAAGDEIWAVILDEASQGSEAATVYPVLLGRRMIELFLRGRQWQTAQEVLWANREHLRSLNLSKEPSV